MGLGGGLSGQHERRNTEAVAAGCSPANSTFRLVYHYVISVERDARARGILPVCILMHARSTLTHV